jgi:DNA modification methylase
MYVDIKKLRISPNHRKIYKSDQIDGLVDKIRDLGQLEPIVVNEQYVIISGVRRYHALLKLDITKALVEVRKVNTQDEICTIIAFNEQRIKTASEILNEEEYYSKLWGQRPGRKAKGNNSQTPVDTRAKIGKKLGISTGNISKLKYIKSTKPELIETIDKGDLTINQAFNALKKVETQKAAIKFQVAPPMNISTADYKIYNKSSDDLRDLDSKSIQCIFTSPPYWAKRSYSGSSNELGAEKTSEDYVQRMAAHLHHCHRVLKDEGSFFLNLGDTFHDKCLQSIPHRVVIELVKRGWILRNTVIWKKLNPLPSSVKDNLTPSYEFIFHLVKSKKYYYNQVLIPAKTPAKAVTTINQKGKNGSSAIPSICINGLKNGKNIEDFWTEDIVTTATANQATVKKYGGSDHPAPFPTEIILLPVIQCSQPGDIVMDVFSGSGSVAEIAILNGRRSVSYEMNPNYNQLQKSRLDAAVDAYNASNQTPSTIDPDLFSKQSKKAA